MIKACACDHLTLQRLIPDHLSTPYACVEAVKSREHRACSRMKGHCVAHDYGGRGIPVQLTVD